MTLSLKDNNTKKKKPFLDVLLLDQYPYSCSIPQNTYYKIKIPFIFDVLSLDLYHIHKTVKRVSCDNMSSDIMATSLVCHYFTSYLIHYFYN